MDLQLNDKTALVLASSSGLGKAIAKELALEGANVMLTSRNKDKLVQAKKEIEQMAKGKVDYMVADVTDAGSINDLVDVTRKTFGKIDILVNNTGGPQAGSFDDMSDSDWQKAFELTLLSYIRAVRAVLPDLKENGGHILNNTSSSVKQPIDGLLLSNVFRMGVQGLSKSLSQELAADGIMVNTIGAGRIETDRLKELDAKRAEKQGISVEEAQEAIKKQIPAGRYGELKEFAKMAAFLVSGVNTYITGQTLLVDGGLTKAF
ncbi:3-oxoacyl-[acyl-carrier protein] reductase [Alkalibacterium sp. AK22]|uniref:SDR family oxidoreductase n=1 Tax=Alkalibacterium sp. AK22 TaxID=1229520 RepID=UPI0004526BC0|nr:SDR family oxidoreductase [Alkalibacterium sp. AK22]EXJ23094.1 3-oxoacyl-[acyl-carrier protein] reductase [Alkalibacterium sp. AK22]